MFGFQFKPLLLGRGMKVLDSLHAEGRSQGCVKHNTGCTNKENPPKSYRF